MNITIKRPNKGDQYSIPKELVSNYGVYTGSEESLKDLIFSVTYITPVTWTMHTTKSGKTKVLFFETSKAQLIKDEIEPRPKNADIKVDEGDAWVIFHGVTEDDDDEESFAFGFAVVDREVIADLIMRDIEDDKIGIVGIGIDRDDNVKEVKDEDEIDPVFLRYAVEHYVNKL